MYKVHTPASDPLLGSVKQNAATLSAVASCEKINKSKMISWSVLFKTWKNPKNETNLSVKIQGICAFVHMERTTSPLLTDGKYFSFCS